MGSSQSSLITSEITDVSISSARSKNGPKTKPTILVSSTTNTVEENEENSSVVSTTESDDDDYSSGEEENEMDEFFAERKLILADAKNLKKLAIDYLLPELPVVVTEPNMFGRNYFGRASAPTEYDDDDNFLTTLSRVREGCVVQDMEDERKCILADAKNLKKLAIDYLHPELPVVVNEPNMFGRNYFGRASAPTEYDDDDNFLTTLSRVREGCVVQDMEDERSAIMEDLKRLKTTADWFLHPGKPVVVSDATTCGRNYFTRPSALQYDETDNFLTTLSRVREGLVVQDMEDERNAIMEDLKQLKTTAEWFLLPEKAVVVSDTTVCGRNYFTRPSAPHYDDDDQEMEDERNAIMEDLKQLKTTADWFLHPEKPTVFDATACGRNYFTRPSALQYDDDDDDQVMEDERNAIMEESRQLKTTADWFLHPEKPIITDGTSCGRNYFSRSSAPGFDDANENERELIMEEMKELKTTATWYLHPEKKVVVMDSASCGRNYFTRASAPKHIMEEERELVLAESAELKKVADWYLHPEKKIVVDPTAFGRNFFTRPSVQEEEGVDMEEERKLVLAEAAELKKVAGWYLHPEKKVAVDSTASGRNFFTRSSAQEEEGVDMEEERKLVLAEAVELKKVADWYLHPEKKIAVDSTAFGRNFFTRPSAPEEEDDAMEEERERILTEAAELKNVADWYLHPEKNVVVDATVFGRNFFTRPSAPEDDCMDDERECILAEAAELKKMANWCNNPSQPVVSNGFATARNFFTRLSAPEEEDDDMDDKRESILVEAAELKKMADWYHNPNQPVVSNGFATGRNYFTRPAAPEYDEDTEEEHERILADAMELKEVAEWYHDPSKPIKTNIAVTRNYFTRPSSLVQDTEYDEQRTKILADALELKHLAIDYLHPEKPVASSSINCVRNFFDRPSAKGNHADYIHTEGHANHPVDHMEEHYVMHDDDYLYDHHHHDDISHGSFQSHGDHFDMDEDVFHGFRESINAFRDSVTSVHDQHIPIIKEEGDGKEGNLSRSPSSIMMAFDEQVM